MRIVLLFISGASLAVIGLWFGAFCGFLFVEHPMILLAAAVVASGCFTAYKLR
jgi:hypothetical protein